MSGEGEGGVENDIESDAQHVRKRPLLPRTSKDSAEPFEHETLGVAEKPLCPRSSYRITKRSKRDASPVDSAVKKTAVVKQGTPAPVSKTRRPWELWSVDDKNSFFEALCEFGKDFENIQSYIAQKGKKKGIATNMIKNKDQVRHFYYRTWHKISKFLQISESVTKQTQELYGLVNYGELRKKIGGCLNEKNRQKLNELVFSGVTTVKHKGKKLRIKTPVCRALKKLNNVTDSKEPETEKLPKDIVVEFQPHTNSAFLQVQSLAQNPRVRTRLSLQKRLKPVIEFLQHRWKPYRLKRKEQIFTCLPSLASPDTCDTTPVLRVKPPRDAKIFPLSLSVIDIASSSDVCLEKFMKLSHSTSRKDVNKTKKSLCLNEKIIRDSLTEIPETVPEKHESILENAVDCADNTALDFQEMIPKNLKKNNSNDGCYFNVLTPPKSIPEEPNDAQGKNHSSLSLFSSLLESANKKLNSNNDNFLQKCDGKNSPTLTELNFQSYEDKSTKIEDNVNTLLANKIECDANLSHSFQVPVKESHSNIKCSKTDIVTINSLNNNVKVVSDAPENLREKEQNISDSIYYRTIKNGWTLEEAGYLTFGEIYLLLGKPSKIVLEYEFEPPEAIFGVLDTDTDSSNRPSSEMSTMLNKLYELAQVYFRDNKSKQNLNKQGRSSKSKAKVPVLNEKGNKDLSQASSAVITIPESSQLNKDLLINKDNVSMKSSMNSANCNTSSDKHVFIRPTGTAPRNIKPPDQNSLKEEIVKLLPSTRRGCRVRRKPLVVQRPLLPREGMGILTGPRPMTLVHLVPSVSSLTSVLPSTCTQSDKLNVPPAKKLMKILPSSPLDIQPIQVPVINQIPSESSQNLVIQQNSVSTQHVVLNSTSRNHLQILGDQNISTLNSLNQNISSTNTLDIIERLPSPTGFDVLNFDLLDDSQTNSVTEENFISMPSTNVYHTSERSDVLSSISAIPDASFLEELGFSTKRPMFEASLGSSAFNEESLATEPLSTPPGSPIQQQFLMNSPDRQWLNGEGPDMSLTTFLNSLESPSKMLTSSPSSSFTESSNFDQIARLAPVVDSQVRCLLDECSIDFIANFEDLADVINNSSSNDSKQT